jgi:hypothetical protein
MQDASDFEMMLGSLRMRGLEGREIQTHPVIIQRGRRDQANDDTADYHRTVYRDLTEVPPPPVPQRVVRVSRSPWIRFRLCSKLREGGRAETPEAAIS